MKRSGIDIYVPSVSIEDQITFYVKELQLFSFYQDYGMGNILLQEKHLKDFFLFLYPAEESKKKSEPLFSISVENCDIELKRIELVKFSSGGPLMKNDAIEVIDYPLGKCFSLIDASGNAFMIAEWY